MKEIRTELKRPAPRPVLVYGAPGIGKTTIKRQILTEPNMVQHFEGRCYWVKADQAHNGEVLLGLIAQELGVDLPAVPNEARVTLLSHLKSIKAPIAIGIDNVETPLGLASLPEGQEALKSSVSAESLLNELGQISHVALLASLRAGAHGMVLDSWRAFEVTSLESNFATTLFLEVCEQGITEGHADENIVKNLVSEVDFVPLAIVLLAKQHKYLRESLPAFYRHWTKKRTVLMQLGNAETKERSWELSLRFSLDSPPIQNTPDASRFIRLMGRLPGGIKRTDVVTTLNLNESSADSAAWLLRDLGLIYLDQQGDRWKMLHPIREYLRDAEAYVPEQEDVRRTGGYYLDLMSAEGKKLGRQGSRAAIKVLTTEIDNIETALLDSLEEGNSRRVQESLVQYGYYIYLAAIISGSLRPLQKGAALPQNIFNNQTIASCIKIIGDIHSKKFELHEALLCYEKAIPIYKGTRSKSGQASCMERIGEIYLHKFDLIAARNYYKKAFSVYKDDKNEAGQANCIKGFGDIYLRRSNLLRVRSCYEKAIPIFKEDGDQLGQANCILRIGDIHLRKSFLHEARSCYEEAVLIFEEAGSKIGQANCILRIGDIHLSELNLSEAKLCYEKSLLIFDEAGTKVGQADCIKGFGDIHLFNMRLNEAELYYEKAISIFDNYEDGVGKANCLLRISEIFLNKLDLYNSKIYCENAYIIHKKYEYELGQAGCIKIFGDIASWSGDVVESKKYFDIALGLYQVAGQRENQAETLLCLSYLPEDLAVREIYQQRALAILSNFLSPEKCRQFVENIERRYRPPKASG